MTAEQRGKEGNLQITQFTFISLHILTEFVDMVFYSKYSFHFHDSGVVVSNSCKPSGNLFWSGVNIQDRCNSNIPFKFTWRYPTYMVKHPQWERKTKQPDSGRASGTSPGTWSAPPAPRPSPSLSSWSCRPSTARSAMISWERETMKRLCRDLILSV